VSEADFWSPMVSRRFVRCAHFWKPWQKEGAFRSLCGLTVQTWQLDAPDDARAKCKLCVRLIEE
jgi:hypothetical protein